VLTARIPLPWPRSAIFALTVDAYYLAVHSENIVSPRIARPHLLIAGLEPYRIHTGTPRRRVDVRARPSRAGELGPGRGSVWAQPLRDMAGDADQERFGMHPRRNQNNKVTGFA
jgi:hypothetical protein